MGLFSKKTNYPSPSRVESERTLQNVMNELDLELKRPSMRRSEYRTMYLRYMTPRVFILMILIVTMVTGLLIYFNVSPFQGVRQDKLNAGTNRVSFSLYNQILVSEVSAQINENPLPVIRENEHKYYIDVTENGLLTLKAQGVLGNRWTQEIEAGGLDADAPELLEHYQIDDRIYIFLSDGMDGSGIDWENICAWETESKEAYEMISYNETEGYVVFPFPDTKIQIQIPDKNGNCLNASLTPNGVMP